MSVRREFQEYDRALAGLTRLSAQVAAGEGDARTRREFVDAIHSVVTAQQRAVALVHRVTLSEALPVGANKTARWKGRSTSSVTAEDLVGVYMMSWDGRRPEGFRFFLLPDGSFYFSGPGGDTHQALAGHWRLTGGRLELNGFSCFTTDCFTSEYDDGRRFSGFHAELRLDIAPPPEPPTSSEVPDFGETRRDVVWLTALRRGPDWCEFFDDLEDDVQDPAERVQELERAAADVIRGAEAEFGDAAWLIQTCDAAIETPPEPAALTHAQMKAVEELTSTAESLARDGFIEEPLRQYAALLARHPSHAAEVREPVRALLAPRLFRRLSEGNEELLFLGSSFEFLRLTRKEGNQIGVDAGDWLHVGEQLTLFGAQQLVIAWPKSGTTPSGYDALPSIILPDSFSAFRKIPALPMSEAECAFRRILMDSGQAPRARG